ncbi:AraC family transcriptional regulator [Sphaerisporangium rufum]|uniref:AraC family transcriptional regulator n=1 Tax=Sphaerisporangium rufum TaxID=1381558 RepID=A0A919QYL4_9ACTN|nr:helix-turn-helix domain-containing protein [Sphaerisporangium rufum]GII76459.1 AraC family transcriptional regulator [Sphaerisporangium rufum]
MHRVAVVVVPPVLSFDVAIPHMVFGGARIAGAGDDPPGGGVADRLGGSPGYLVEACTAEPGTVTAADGPGLLVPRGLDAAGDADTVMVVGSGGGPADPATLAALRAAAAAGARLASLCTGAFVLAQAGLLDGRRATTHWDLAAELAARHPAVRVQPDTLFVDDGGVLTSAGAGAAIDLCLHLVRLDYGAAVASAAARAVVAAPARPGGQPQVVAAPTPPERGTSLAATRGWALERLELPLSLADLAGHAGVSVRTLIRRFHAETGTSPLRWLLHQRIGRARELLETTGLPMDQVAARSGLGGADSLRRHLVAALGVTPSAYRARFTRHTA